MVADLTYARLALEETYPTGDWLDVAYTVGWLSLGFAGVVQVRGARSAGAPVGTAHLRPIPALPYLATALVFGLVARLDARTAASTSRSSWLGPSS